MTVENISIDVKTNAGSAARQFTSLSNAINRVASAGKSVKSGGTSKAVSNIGHAAKSANAGVGKLFASLKRIALYRMLRTVIKNITQAFQEGLKHAYHFSQSVGGALAQALDQMSSASGQMKNQMGAAFGELLQTIMPIIEAIIAAITRLMQALSALFAALGGRATFLVADKAADSWDKASGAAKKYKNTILGFDEINRLNDEQGGGGGGSSDFGGGFSETELPDWAEKIRKAIEDGDWYAAGKALADHLNELIDQWDAYEAGRKLGEKINHVIEFAFGFLKNFDFGNLGKKVAEFFNGIFDTVNWDMLGRTLVRAITGIIDFLIGFITNLDTGSIARAISDFVKGALEEATEWLSEHNWKEFGKTITQKIHDSITNVDWGGIGALLSGFLVKTFISITNLLKGTDFAQLTRDVFDAISDFISNVNWDRIAETALELLSAALFAAGSILGAAIERMWHNIILPAWQKVIDWWHDKAYQDGEFTIEGVLEGILLGWRNILEWIGEHICKPFIEGFRKAFKIGSPSKLMAEQGVFVAEGILEGILQPFKEIYNWVKTNITDPLINSIKSLLGISGESNSSIFSSIGEKIVNGLSAGFKSAWDLFLRNVEQWWNTLKTWFDGRSLNLTLKGTTVNEGGFSHSSGKIEAEASGGMIPNTGTLFVAGEAGAEVVTQMGNQTGVTNVKQMGEAVAYGNSEVVNAVYAMANMIVKAVDSKDVDVILDGQSMADRLYRYNQQAANRYGVAMVT